MSVIVTDTGFAADDWTGTFTDLGAIAANDGDFAVDLSSDTNPQDLTAAASASMVRIDFPSFADGRGFTLAAILRRHGYTGRLRAKGHVLADQYAMARRSGFDEVEISDDLAARQPENQWRARADWNAHDYQSRVRG